MQAQDHTWWDLPMDIIPHIIISVGLDAGSGPYLPCGKHTNVCFYFYDYNLLSASQDWLPYLRKRLLRKTSINFMFLISWLPWASRMSCSLSLVISPFPRGKPLIWKKKKPTGSFRFLLSSVLFLENASTSSKHFYALGLISISQQYQNYHMGWVAILWWPTTAGQGQSAKQGAICNLSGPHSKLVAESGWEHQGS